MEAFKIIELDTKVRLICITAVNYYGPEHQDLKLVEEYAELETAIADKNQTAQIEEVADVIIMKLQCGTFNGIHDWIEKYRSSLITIMPGGRVDGIALEACARHTIKKMKGHGLQIGNGELPQIYNQVEFKINRLANYIESKKGWLPGFENQKRSEKLK